MPTFVILSRISPQAFDDPKDFKALAKDVSEKIKRECPGVTWKIRAYGHASTETLIATPWKEFLAAL